MNQFKANSRYFTISMYAIFVILIGAIIFRLVNNWEATSRLLGSTMKMLSPFWIGFLIAYLLNPLVIFIDEKVLLAKCNMQKSNQRKLLSIILCYIIVLSALVFLMLFLLPEVIQSLPELVNKVDALYQSIDDITDNLVKKYPQVDFTLLTTYINDALPGMIDDVKNMLTNFVPYLYDFSIGLITSLINLLIALVVSFYMIFDKHILLTSMEKIMYAYVPKERISPFIKHCRECNRIFRGFIVGKALDSLIIGIMCFVLMAILGLPFTMLISVIVGITNMIPYFGPFIGAVPGILILLVQEPMDGAIFAILIFALQQFDGLYLGPKILGDSVGIRPLWIIVGITVGGYMGGVIGMFLAVPIIAVIMYLWNLSIDARLDKRKILPENMEEL